MKVQKRERSMVCFEFLTVDDSRHYNPAMDEKNFIFIIEVFSISPEKNFFHSMPTNVRDKLFIEANKVKSTMYALVVWHES